MIQKIILDDPKKENSYPKDGTYLDIELHVPFFFWIIQKRDDGGWLFAERGNIYSLISLFFG